MTLLGDPDKIQNIQRRYLRMWTNVKLQTCPKLKTHQTHVVVITCFLGALPPNILHRKSWARASVSRRQILVFFKHHSRKLAAWIARTHPLRVLWASAEYCPLNHHCVGVRNFAAHTTVTTWNFARLLVWTTALPSIPWQGNFAGEVLKKRKHNFWSGWVGSKKGHRFQAYGGRVARMPWMKPRNCDFGAMSQK